MRKVLLIHLSALLAGMCGAEVGAEPAFGKPNREGLATRLVPLTEAPQVGAPLLFRLEGKNTGTVTVYADIQTLAHPDCLLTIKDGAGKEVPVISPDLIGCQTSASYTAFPPGKVVVLAGRIDAAQEFEISRAETYRFRHPGVTLDLPDLGEGAITLGINGEKLDAKTVFTKLPPSPVVPLAVRKGKVPVDLDMILRLRPILPENWFICRRDLGGGVHLGTHGEVGFVLIDLVPAQRNAKLEDGQRVLGGSPLGEIRMGVEIGGGKNVAEPPKGTGLGDYWPGAEQAIRKALEIAPSET